jgi:hypothetical protein
LRSPRGVGGGGAWRADSRLGGVLVQVYVVIGRAFRGRWRKEEIVSFEYTN